jgi:outer membrane protein assembly factor BamB
MAPPVALGSVVADAVGGRAIGYDARTGAVLWTAGGVPAQAQLHAAAGLVLATSAAMGPGMPTAVTALVPSSGRVAWRFDSGAAASVGGAGPAGLVLWTSVPDALYLIDPATGRARWRAATYVDDPVPLITARDVIVPEGRQRQAIVDRLASSGAVRWAAPVSFAPPSMPALLAGSRVVTVTDPATASGAGTLSALDLGTGRPAWQVPLPTTIFVSPAMTPGGDVLAEPSDVAQACPA